MRSDRNMRIWNINDAPIQDTTMGQLLNCAEQMDLALLMADNQEGYGVPVGGVMASRNLIYLAGVGYDIGCGNTAMKLSIDSSAVIAFIKEYMDDIAAEIPIGIGVGNKEKVVTEFFDLFGKRIKEIEITKPLIQLAESQLGSVGGGNHFVDIFISDTNEVWIGVHFGSRGFGWKIADWFLKKVGSSNNRYEKPVALDVNSELGQLYIECMEIAGAYAMAGRRAVCQKLVDDIFGCNVLDIVENHHNFAWKEEHGNEIFWIARKGSTPNRPGQRSFIGGSMGNISVIIKGIDSEESRQTLYSTVHGAGRVISRSRAKKTIDVKAHEKAIAKIELRGSELDESPLAYRPLQDVLNVHRDTFEIQEVLHPIGVRMAGKNEKDPFKD